MTRLDNATQGKFTYKQRIPNSVDDPCHAYYPTATDWETFLVRTSVVITIVTFLVVFFIV
jgi:hypothetical protein